MTPLSIKKAAPSLFGMNSSNQTQAHTIAYDNKSQAIKYEDLRRAFRKLPEREALAIGLLFGTGGRIQELGSMTIDNVRPDGTLYWPVGKNQKGFRHIVLDKRFLKRVQEHREGIDRADPRLLKMGGPGFSRRFQYARPSLSEEWQRMHEVKKGGKYGHVHDYNLAGIRKSYVTLRVAQEWRRLGDVHLAILKVQQEMRHSSPHMTAHHYVEDMQRLEVWKWVHLDPWEILLGDGRQSKLCDFTTRTGSTHSTTSPEIAGCSSPGNQPIAHASWS